MARHKNVAWKLAGEDGAGSVSYESTKCALLMDIRDELQELNKTLACRNMQMIPSYLRRIAGNTAKKKKARK